MFHRVMEVEMNIPFSSSSLNEVGFTDMTYRWNRWKEQQARQSSSISGNTVFRVADMDVRISPELIGEGTQAKVYKAVDMATGRTHTLPPPPPPPSSIYTPILYHIYPIITSPHTQISFPSHYNLVIQFLKHLSA